MTNLTDHFNPAKTHALYAYVDHRKTKIGYAYTTRNGNICIKANKMLDKTQLGRMLVKGVYLNLTEWQED